MSEKTTERLAEDLINAAVLAHEANLKLEAAIARSGVSEQVVADLRAKITRIYEEHPDE
ncbi:hypothetical protein ABTY61_05870 [Kitasatospora sp. NPDC096128]|uniref:hypothetical protein n=1 Tax=Kitasatospora sp. NPDC096128 TaxID=3155547 RepID=UPI00332E4173